MLKKQKNHWVNNLDIVKIEEQFNMNLKSPFNINLSFFLFFKDKKVPCRKHMNIYADTPANRKLGELVCLMLNGNLNKEKRKKK